MITLIAEYVNERLDEYTFYNDFLEENTRYKSIKLTLFVSFQEIKL